MSLLKKPIFWIAVVGLSGAAWVATSPEDTGKKAVPKVAKRSTKKKVDVKFTREDFEAKFAPVKSDLKNVFVPVIAKTSGLGGADGLANVIPAEFAGGDGSWTYTGNAEVDGVPTALLENRASGDGVFLRAGERWKSAVVVSIGPNNVVMKGPSGTKTFALVDNERPKALAGGFAPVRVNPGPEIRGQIGRGQPGTAIQFPNDPAPGAIMMTPSDEDPQPVFIAPPEVQQ
ncbi:MAG: hypothetical protein K1X67_19825 [Fimbriimonadaceae bacterium]|nr:hypothetical protein [Fimbriimonadaceae bacterium]